MKLTIEQFREIISLREGAVVKLYVMIDRTSDWLKLNVAVRGKEMWQYREMIEVPEKPGILIRTNPKNDEPVKYSFEEGGEEFLLQKNYPEEVSAMLVKILSVMINEAFYLNSETTKDYLKIKA